MAVALAVHRGHQGHQVVHIAAHVAVGASLVALALAAANQPVAAPVTISAPAIVPSLVPGAAIALHVDETYHDHGHDEVANFLLSAAGTTPSLVATASCACLP